MLLSGKPTVLHCPQPLVVLDYRCTSQAELLQAVQPMTVMTKILIFVKWSQFDMI